MKEIIKKLTKKYKFICKVFFVTLMFFTNNISYSRISRKHQDIYWNDFLCMYYYSSGRLIAIILLIRSLKSGLSKSLTSIKVTEFNP